MRSVRTGVLVIGGALSGLASALFLREHGCACLLAERHSDTSRHPRARGVNIRTMELLRGAGIAERVRATDSARNLAGNGGIAVLRSLTGGELAPFRQDYLSDPRADPRFPSPSRWCLCDQDELERLLRRRAGELGADLRFGTEVTDLARTGDGGYRAVLRPDGGEPYAVLAEYVIAADGARGGVRRRIGVGMRDHRTLSRSVSVHVRADLRAALGDRRFLMGYVAGDAVKGVLVPVDNAERWLLHVPYFPERGQSPADFTSARCVELFRAAAGVPGLDVDVLDVLPWDSAAGVADRYADGGVFFVGDCAHVMPPSGAFGANTGVQDAHNLAWKLALRLSGRAGTRLLGTYEAERRPVALATVAQAVLRSHDRPRIGRDGADADEGSGIVADETVQLGYTYRSAAICAPSRTPGMAWSDGTAMPGARAPHLRLGRAGRSVIDVFGPGFTLLTGPGGAAWRVAVRGLRGAVPVRAFQIGVDDTDADGAWPDRYGAGDAAHLVRPDGFVAWSAARYTPGGPAGLAAALAEILG